MSSYIGEIIFFGGDFEPRDWLICDGREVAISSYQMLYSIISTKYGGNGRTTFRLPDLRGRVPIGMGQPPGGSHYPIGEKGGNESITLSRENVPHHSHDCPLSNVSGGMKVSTVPANHHEPFTDCQICSTTDGAGNTANVFTPPDSGPTVPLGGIRFTNTSGATTGSTGGGQPQTNMMPYMAINAFICFSGLHPSRP